MNSLQLREMIERVGNTDEYVLFKVRLRGLERNETKLEMLWMMYKIAKYTDVFTDEVREFLFNEDVNYKSVSENYGVTESNFKNKIFRQMKKFSELIGSNLYEDVKNNNITEEESYYILEDLKSIYNKREKVVKTLESNFYEDIFSGRDISKDFSDIDDEDYVFARDAISRISIPATRFILDNLEEDFLDYIVFLIQTPEDRLTQRDRDRKENLLGFLKIG